MADRYFNLTGGEQVNFAMIQTDKMHLIDKLRFHP